MATCNEDVPPIANRLAIGRLAAAMIDTPVSCSQVNIVFFLQKSKTNFEKSNKSKKNFKSQKKK